MPYRLKRGESVPEGIRRVATEELETAIGQIEKASAKTRDTAVHEARKSVKKVRGALRLVRGGLGRVYRTENKALRDAGRGLSELRDATAIISTFDMIAKKYRRELRGSLGPIRKGLLHNKQEKEKKLLADRVMKNAVSAFRSALQRVPKWPLTTDGFEAAGPGFKDSYRLGRRAMRAALQEDSPDRFHAWRRRAKDHWYHVRLLENLWPEEMQAREEDLHELETALGDDHNLLVLCELLSDNPEAFGGEEQVELFSALATREQKELREKSVALGKRLYQERAAEFESRFRKLWHTWETTTKVPRPAADNPGKPV